MMTQAWTYSKICRSIYMYIMSLPFRGFGSYAYDMQLASPRLLGSHQNCLSSRNFLMRSLYHPYAESEQSATSSSLPNTRNVIEATTMRLTTRVSTYLDDDVPCQSIDNDKLLLQLQRRPNFVPQRFRVSFYFPYAGLM